MRYFLIAAHGNFSSGIKSSIDIIAGKIENVFIIDAYSDGNKSIEDELGRILSGMQANDELIVCTDLMGGSITNQLVRFALQENVHIIAGMNLPLLLEIMLADAETPVTEIIENAITLAREQLVYVNKLIKKGNDD